MKKLVYSKRIDQINRGKAIYVECFRNGEFYLGSKTQSFWSGAGLLVTPKNVVYEGGFSYSKFHGYGYQTLPKGITFAGEFYRGSRNGAGKLTDNGSDFIGNFEEGKRTGAGILKDSDGRVVKGFYSNDSLTGFGFVFAQKGLYRFKGMFRKGYFHGVGQEIHKGTKYLGHFARGKKHGLGFIKLGEEAKFLGTWSKGSREGFGIEHFSNFDLYEGDFLDNARTGVGRYVYRKSGFNFMGEFEEGLRSGFGKLEGDKMIFIGNWRDNKRDGLGYQKLADGRAYFGYWKDDVRHGIGYEFGNDIEYKGEWLEDKPHGKGIVKVGNNCSDVAMFDNGVLIEKIKKGVKQFMNQVHKLDLKSFFAYAEPRILELDAYVGNSRARVIEEYNSLPFNPEVHEKNLNSELRGTFETMDEVYEQISETRAKLTEYCQKLSRGQTKDLQRALRRSDAMWAARGYASPDKNSSIQSQSKSSEAYDDSRYKTGDIRSEFYNFDRPVKRGTIRARDLDVNRRRGNSRDMNINMGETTPGALITGTFLTDDGETNFRKNMANSLRDRNESLPPRFDSRDLENIQKYGSDKEQFIGFNYNNASVNKIFEQDQRYEDQAQPSTDRYKEERDRFKRSKELERSLDRDYQHDFQNQVEKPKKPTKSSKKEGLVEPIKAEPESTSGPMKAKPFDSVAQKRAEDSGQEANQKNRDGQIIDSKKFIHNQSFGAEKSAGGNTSKEDETDPQKLISLVDLNVDQENLNRGKKGEHAAEKGEEKKKDQENEKKDGEKGAEAAKPSIPSANPGSTANNDKEKSPDQNQTSGKEGQGKENQEESPLRGGLMTNPVSETEAKDSTTNLPETQLVTPKTVEYTESSVTRSKRIGGKQDGLEQQNIFSTSYENRKTQDDLPPQSGPRIPVMKNAAQITDDRVQVDIQREEDARYQAKSPATLGDSKPYSLYTDERYRVKKMKKTRKKSRSRKKRSTSRISKKSRSVSRRLNYPNSSRKSSKTRMQLTSGFRGRNTIKPAVKVSMVPYWRVKDDSRSRRGSPSRDSPSRYDSGAVQQQPLPRSRSRKRKKRKNRRGQESASSPDRQNEEAARYPNHEFYEEDYGNVYDGQPGAQASSIRGERYIDQNLLSSKEISSRVKSQKRTKRVKRKRKVPPRVDQPEEDAVPPSRQVVVFPSNFDDGQSFVRYEDYELMSELQYQQHRRKIRKGGIYARTGKRLNRDSEWGREVVIYEDEQDTIPKAQEGKSYKGFFSSKDKLDLDTEKRPARSRSRNRSKSSHRRGKASSSIHEDASQSIQEVPEDQHTSGKDQGDPNPEEDIVLDESQNPKSKRSVSKSKKLEYSEDSKFSPSRISKELDQSEIIKKSQDDSLNMGKSEGHSNLNKTEGGELDDSYFNKNDKSDTLNLYDDSKSKSHSNLLGSKDDSFLATSDKQKSPKPAKSSNPIGQENIDKFGLESGRNDDAIKQAIRDAQDSPDEGSSSAVDWGNASGLSLSNKLDRSKDSGTKRKGSQRIKTDSPFGKKSPEKKTNSRISNSPFNQKNQKKDPPPPKKKSNISRIAMAFQTLIKKATDEKQVGNKSPFGAKSNKLKGNAFLNNQKKDNEDEKKRTGLSNSPKKSPVRNKGSPFGQKKDETVEKETKSPFGARKNNNRASPFGNKKKEEEKKEEEDKKPKSPFGARKNNNNRASPFGNKKEEEEKKDEKKEEGEKKTNSPFGARKTNNRASPFGNKKKEEEKKEEKKDEKNSTPKSNNNRRSSPFGNKNKKEEEKKEEEEKKPKSPFGARKTNNNRASPFGNKKKEEEKKEDKKDEPEKKTNSPFGARKTNNRASPFGNKKKEEEQKEDKKEEEEKKPKSPFGARKTNNRASPFGNKKKEEEKKDEKKEEEDKKPKSPFGARKTNNRASPFGNKKKEEEKKDEKKEEEEKKPKSPFGARKTNNRASPFGNKKKEEEKKDEKKDDGNKQAQTPKKNSPFGASRTNRASPFNQNKKEDEKKEEEKDEPKNKSPFGARKVNRNQPTPKKPERKNTEKDEMIERRNTFDNNENPFEDFPSRRREFGKSPAPQESDTSSDEDDKKKSSPFGRSNLRSNKSPFNRNSPFGNKKDDKAEADKKDKDNKNKPASNNRPSPFKNSPFGNKNKDKDKPPLPPLGLKNKNGSSLRTPQKLNSKDLKTPPAPKADKTKNTTGKKDSARSKGSGFGIHDSMMEKMMAEVSSKAPDLGNDDDFDKDESSDEEDSDML